MGPVDAGTSDQDEAPPDPGDSREESRKKSGTGPRRLYLIHEGSMLGGVCKGLAVYFNIDVTIIRLIWTVLTLATGGFLVLFYVAALIIIPYAETPSERAEAYGIAFNAQHLVEQAKKHYSNLKSGSQKWWQRSTQWWNQRPHGAVNPATQIATIVMVPVAAVFIAFVSVVWILAVISLVTTGSVLGIPLPAAIPVWMAILILVALHGIVVSPVKGAFRAWRHSDVGYSALALLGGAVWLGLFIFALWFAYNYIPEFQAVIEALPSILSDLFRR
jgi:phage shock protein PspC (stress-responsive transcriptional regulator)